MGMDSEENKWEREYDTRYVLLAVVGVIIATFIGINYYEEPVQPALRKKRIKDNAVVRLQVESEKYDNRPIKQPSVPTPDSSVPDISDKVDPPTEPAEGLEAVANTPEKRGPIPVPLQETPYQPDQPVETPAISQGTSTEIAPTPDQPPSLPIETSYNPTPKPEPYRPNFQAEFIQGFGYPVHSEEDDNTRTDYFYNTDGVRQYLGIVTYGRDDNSDEISFRITKLIVNQGEEPVEYVYEEKRRLISKTPVVALSSVTEFYADEAKTPEKKKLLEQSTELFFETMEMLGL